MTGSPISDLNPIFMAAGIKLNLCSLKHGNRTIPMDHTFFIGYRRNVVLPEEMLVSIDIPFSKQVEIQRRLCNIKLYLLQHDIFICNFAESIFYCLQASEKTRR